MKKEEWIDILRRAKIYGWVDIIRDAEDNREALFCPFCGSENVNDANYFLIRVIRREATLFCCADCASFFGRHT